MSARFPIPTTLSPEARAVLAAVHERPPLPTPTPSDTEGWAFLEAAAASTEPEVLEIMALSTVGAVPSDEEVDVVDRTVGDATFIVATPRSTTSEDRRVLLNMHGGGFTFGGGATARRSTQLLAGNMGLTTWGMDYRQLPHHPFPAGLDDCMTVYRLLLEDRAPEDVVVVGQSGGANLAAALMLRIRDEGLPTPAGLGLVSPPTDFTFQGETWYTNAEGTSSDGFVNMLALYKGEYPAEHPYISPLFGEWDDSFPPMIITSGTRDMLLSDAVRLHRTLVKAGVKTELHVWEGAPHGFFMGRAPEDHEHVQQVRTFLHAQLQ
ncbi:acetyl esterase/lipase [Rathayibacter sp. PhB93]|uniref:alpha/beta hydrolase n=1 Tax=unclassified Rathayibacter TaxID=2609250 RepID=UPI000F4A8FC8|nr:MULTISPECIES: alpha/beta hydrolase [unclassified Rathayibacter]ROQ00946.1 acetyl esterase/lipase [Rathayibacter sp. PhB93]TDQ07300.1 acetyl esterase/lipase [Rathayibacter sp. PhB1]